MYARKRRLRPSRRAFVEIELAGIIRRMRLWLARRGRIKWVWSALIFEPQPQICKVAGRPRKNEAHGDFVGIVGAVEAASLATGGAVVLQRAMFQFADGDQPNRSDSRMNLDVNLYDRQIGRFSPLRMRPV